MCLTLIQVINLAVTQKLIRLCASPEASCDASWPSNEIFRNPMVRNQQRRELWNAAQRLLEEEVHKICAGVMQACDLGRVAVIMRLGLVPSSDRSLIIAVSGESPSGATAAVREILERLTRVELTHPRQTDSFWNHSCE